MEAAARRKSRRIYLGDVPIGDGAPVAVQSMTNTETRDVVATLEQIASLAEAGCEIIRVAIPDKESAFALEQIVTRSPLPVIADIHFDYRLAIMSHNAGVAGLRLNPGNIGGTEKVNLVIDALEKRPIPVRVGVNSGSLEREYLKLYGGPTPAAMTTSCLKQLEIFTSRGYHELKISLKSSNVVETVQAYHLLAEKVDYPFHIGITEAGILPEAAVRSAVGIGILLYEGLGDTLRVSLTGDPLPEVAVAWEILSSLELRRRGPKLIACPTCARTRVALEPLVREVKERISGLHADLIIAVMGCEVNGPGEAKMADIGIAGAGHGKGILFRKGEKIAVLEQNEIVDRLMEEIDKLMKIKEKSG